MSPRKAKPPHGLLLGWQEPAPGSKGGFPTPIWDDGGEGHLVTVAPTGAGKGVSCIIPALLTWRGPAIVIDPKGENYAVTAAHRRAMGQKVHVLDPFQITGCLQAASLNPFDMLGALRTASVDDMRVLAQAVVQQSGFGKNQDPYWDNRAMALIVEAIRHVARHLPKPTLRDVREVVELYDRACGTGLRDYACGHPCHHEIPHAFEPVGMATDKTRICITSTAIDQLAFISDGAVSGSLWNSTIDLRKVLRGDPMTIYLVLPPDKLVTHGKLLRLWLITLINTLSKRVGRPRHPTLLMVDEAAQLARVKEIATAVTLMRGYGMKVWLFFQDLSQLQAAYRDEWESLLNNCAFHQYFGASTPMAARTLQNSPTRSPPATAATTRAARCHGFCFTASWKWNGSAAIPRCSSYGRVPMPFTDTKTRAHDVLVGKVGAGETPRRAVSFSPMTPASSPQPHPFHQHGAISYLCADAKPP
ncbi:MAG: type IV secretory system conjugative DNA transfer family protein [Proteobacteria bacterium]|nr:type IV secretory system conjugative DNA transfer family protein [Pseudomonadota bacterium]